MSKRIDKLLPTLLVLGILLIGIFFRVYNLNWGAPYYFHPDERNIASSVSQLKFPDQMNPHFFAYGSLPIYTIYLTGLAYNTITNQSLSVSFEQAIIISRLYSVLFSSLTTILIYLIAKKIKNETSAVTALILSSLSVGLIQFSHFGTFEMWLTFFSLLQVFLLTLYIKTQKNHTFLFAAVTTGILVSIKISSLPLALLPLGILLFSRKTPTLKSEMKGILEEKKIPWALAQGDSLKIKKAILPVITNATILLIAIPIIFITTSPYALLDYTSFRSSIRYESSVALGTLPVFYTGEFYNTAPVIFQFIYIYPFLINPLLTILFSISLVWLIIKSIQTKNPVYILLISAFLIHFLSQAFLFTKWTRYIIPTLPFIYLIITFAFNESLNKYQKTLTIILSSFAPRAGLRRISAPLKEEKIPWTLVHGASLTLVSTVFALSFIKTVYFDKDTRLLALEFAQKNIPAKSLIVSDVYDLGIVPFNNHYPLIALYNFYDLENSLQTPSYKKIKETIKSYDYYILPSPRIIRNRLLKKGIFPKGNAFYNALTNGNLGFTKIYETPCDIFCKIVYIGNPVWNVEETANVFDHPTIFIFKKTK